MKNNSSTRTRRIVMTAAVLAGAAAATLGLATPANAATTACGGLTCTVYLDRGETAALAQGRVPNLNLGAFTLPYKALAYGHVVIAKGWAARGNCVAFQVSLLPWATQGMAGWRC